jgi:hypothetical protein
MDCRDMQSPRRLPNLRRKLTGSKGPVTWNTTITAAYKFFEKLGVASKLQAPEGSYHIRTTVQNLVVTAKLCPGFVHLSAKGCRSPKRKLLKLSLCDFIHPPVTAVLYNLLAKCLSRKNRHTRPEVHKLRMQGTRTTNCCTVQPRFLKTFVDPWTRHISN